MMILCWNGIKFMRKRENFQNLNAYGLANFIFLENLSLQITSFNHWRGDLMHEVDENEVVVWNYTTG